MSFRCALTGLILTVTLSPALSQPKEPPKQSTADKAIADAIRALEAAAKADLPASEQAKLRAAINGLRAAGAASPISPQARTDLVERLRRGYAAARGKAGKPIPREAVVSGLGSYLTTVKLLPLTAGEVGSLKTAFGETVEHVIDANSAVIELRPGAGYKPKLILEGIDTSGLADGLSQPPNCAVCITGTRKVGGTTYFVATAFVPNEKELATIMAEDK